MNSRERFEATCRFLPVDRPFFQLQEGDRQPKECLAKCSGFILGPCHKIQTDTPVEDILAMYEEGAGT